MTLILTAIVIALTFIKFFIFADIVLSWLSLLGFKARPEFIASVVDPLYGLVKKKIPTTIGPIDLTPIVVIILIEVLIYFIYGLSREVFLQMTNLPTIF